ncbi:MAG: pentapeptide repeat-containing protein [Bacteroidetes bacterium]|nr:pentapeptide repeat-containing protein [Bacteroidota bacterium]
MDTLIEWFGGNIYKNTVATVALLITVTPLIWLVVRKIIIKDNVKKIGIAFKETVAGLSSPNLEVRMSSAILLRRFLYKKSEYGVGGTPFADDTVSVIVAVLKTLQTSDFQKVLSDTLRFAQAKYLINGDFQRANLTKAFLGSKNDEKKGMIIDMTKADFFQANLSGTLLKNAVLNEAQFYEASLLGTKFNKAKLRNANFNSAVLQSVDFTGADLTGASFDNAKLRGVDFSGALLNGVSGINSVGENLIDGPSCIKQLQYSNTDSNKVFISRLGVLDARQRMFVNNVKDIVEQSNSTWVELNRDMYDASNVLSSLSNKIDSCSAMIVFGFKSMHIIDGIFRYSTEDSRTVRDEFLATPWNHLEVGMAVMKRIPVLLIIDDGVNDGAFHNNINDELLVKLPISSCLDTKKNNVSTWLESVVNL